MTYKKVKLKERGYPHPDLWWNITREYKGIKLGAIVLFNGEQMRVRRIERLSERPFLLSRAKSVQSYHYAYRDEIELIEQGEGIIYGRPAYSKKVRNR